MEYGRGSLVFSNEYLSRRTVLLHSVQNYGYLDLAQMPPF